MFSGRFDNQGSNYVEIYAKMPKYIFLFEILILNTYADPCEKGYKAHNRKDSTLTYANHYSSHRR